MNTTQKLLRIRVPALKNNYKQISTTSNLLQNKYYLLKYDYNPVNLIERRAPHREEHLKLAREYASKGMLLLGGAFASPIDGAALIFKGSEKEVQEFIRKDPYIQKGIATGHSYREWTVLVGSHLKLD